MTNLYTPLPNGVKIDGHFYTINTSFRVWLQAEKIMSNTERDQAEQIGLLLGLCYKNPTECCTNAHLDELLKFYRCGHEPTGDGEHAVKPAYDFEQDADYIYAAFLQVYGIDLFKMDLHWWAFRALFASLPDTCAMSRIMGYRTVDTKDMSKGQKKFYKRMQHLYALKDTNAPKRKMTLKERDQMWRDKVLTTFEKAGEQQNG